ncbi:MAG: histidine phosphatase family protein [Roseiflexaceae bacterium]|jgi:alpha-ribazole phosphatase|nr:histidine phosphatase family protein [Chloroflexaceae bacterium]
MHIVFVRHGETAYNASGRYQGHTQISLNERGFQQAHVVAQRLRYTRFDALYSSDLLRAIQTADAIAQYHTLPVIQHAGFREIDVGLWEHLTVTEIATNYPQHFAIYKQTPGRAVYTGGESYAHMQLRAMSALMEVIDQHPPEATIGIVCHGGTIRALVCAFLHIDIDYYPQMWIDNCAITTAFYQQSVFRLGTLNDNAHAEPDWRE